VACACRNQHPDRRPLNSSPGRDSSAATGVTQPSSLRCRVWNNDHVTLGRAQPQTPTSAVRSFPHGAFHCCECGACLSWAQPEFATSLRSSSKGAASARCAVAIAWRRNRPHAAFAGQIARGSSRRRVCNAGCLTGPLARCSGLGERRSLGRTCSSAPPGARSSARRPRARAAPPPPRPGR
jgi:hypothetical protein